MREIVEYPDDDCSNGNPRLRILWNHQVDGDIHISIRTDTEMSPSVRLCASGGASSRVPGLRIKIVEAFELITKYLYNERTKDD